MRHGPRASPQVILFGPKPSLSGDVNAKVDESTIEELLVKIKEEYKELGPLLDLDVVGEAQGSRTKRPWPRTASSHAVKHG